MQNHNSLERIIMNTHFFNAVTIIPDSNNHTLSVSKEDIYVNDGIIGDKLENSDYTDIDLHHALILPGMVNSHHHIYSYFAKALSFSGKFNTFENILQNIWWKLDRVLTEETVKISSELTAQECIAHGVTTVFDHHSSPYYIRGSLDIIGNTLSEYSLNGVLCHEISDRNGINVMEETLEENIDFAHSDRFDNIQGIIGLHALFTLSDKSLKRIAGNSGYIPIHLHIAEGKVDGRQSRMKHGKRLAERLNEFNLIRENSIFVHGNYLTPEDIEILSAGRNVFFSQCVDSNMNNNQDILNLLFADAGNLIYTAGTDGMTSDILKSIKSSILLNKYNFSTSPVLSEVSPDSYPTKIFSNLFLNQYRLKNAYGYDLGLNKGDMADFAVVEYPFAELINESNFFNHFLYGITESRVKHVFKNNNFLMKDFVVQNKKDTEIKRMQNIIADVTDRLGKI